MNTILRYLCLNLLCLFTLTFAMNAQSKIVIRSNFSSGATTGNGIGTGKFRVIGGFGGIVGRAMKYSGGFLATPKQIQPSNPSKDTTATFPLQVQWVDSSGAHLFVVEVSNSKDFVNPMYRDSVRRPTAPSYNFTTQLPADPFSISTPYYLRIVAIHHGGIADGTPIQITRSVGIGPPKITEPISGQEYSTCKGDSVRIITRVIGGKRPYTYVWKRADGKDINRQDTIYSGYDSVKIWKNIPEGTTQMELQITDASSPTLTDIQKWVLIGKKEPHPLITANSDSICKDGSTTLSIPKGYTSIVWKLNSIPIPNETNDVLTITKAGKYTVEVDSNSCKGSSNEKEIFYYKKPTVSIIPNDPSVTKDSLITFKAIDTNETVTSYSWKNKKGLSLGSTNTIDYKVTGEDSITLIYHYGDGGSCVDSIATTIKIFDPSKPNVSLKADKSPICIGDVITLEASIAGGKSPYTKVWKKDGSIIPKAEIVSISTPDSLSIRIKPSDTGIHAYSITVVDRNSNSTTDSVKITVNRLPTKPTISLNGDTLLVSSIEDRYQWLDSDTMPIANAKNQSYKPKESGIYYVRVTNAAGCEALSDQFKFTLKSKIDTNSIDIFMKLEPHSAKPGGQVQVLLYWTPPKKDDGLTFNGRLFWNTRIAECVTPDPTIEKHFGKDTGGISFKNILLRTGSYTVSLEILLGDETQTRIFLDNLSPSPSNSTTRLIPNMIDSSITVTGVTCDSSGIPRLVTWKNPPSVTVTVLPNPSTSTSTISVEPKTAEGLVELYSVYGDKILSTTLQQGSVQINSMNLSDGVYSIVVRSTDGIGRTTMIVVK